MKRNRLKQITIDEVSLVDEPANQSARVLIYKRAAQSGFFYAGSPGFTQDGEDAMTPEEIEKKLGELEAQVEKAHQERNAMQAERDAAIAKAGMSDAEKAYMDGMPEKERAAFMAMSPGERKAKMDACKKSAEDVTKALPDEVRKQLAEVETLRKRLENAEAKQSEMEFAKRAETEYPALPGTPEEKGRVLKALDAIADEDVRKTANGYLKAHNDALAAGMVEKGTTRGSEGASAVEKLDTLAKSYAKEHNVGYHAAYDAVLKTADGAALYTASLK